MRTGLEIAQDEEILRARPFSPFGQGTQIMSQIDASIGVASQAISMSLDSGAESQIQAIKDNLKYLEENMIRENIDKASKPDLTEEEIRDLLKKFGDQVPKLEEMIRKLQLRKEADPTLEEMIDDLREAMSLEKVHDQILRAKLEVIDQAAKMVDILLKGKSEAEKAAEEAAANEKIKKAKQEAQAKVVIAEADAQKQVA